MSGADTKAKIVQAAIDLFYEHGFSKASMRDIARTANITLSGSYNHFRDKYDILYTILMRMGLDTIKMLDSVEENSGGGIDTLSNIIANQLYMIRERKKEIKIYMEDQYQLPMPLRSAVLAQHRIVYERYYRQVELLEKEDLLKPINKKVITFSILGMVNWAYRWYQEGGQLSMEEVAGDIVKICLGGILKEPFRVTANALPYPAFGY